MRRSSILGSGLLGVDFLWRARFGMWLWYSAGAQTEKMCFFKIIKFVRMLFAECWRCPPVFQTMETNCCTCIVGINCCICKPFVTGVT